MSDMVLRTIYTYIILFNVFRRNKLNDFSMDTLWVFIWFLNDFYLEFCFNLSEGAKKFFFIEVVFFYYFHFGDVVWNSHQLVLLLLRALLLVLLLLLGSSV